MKEIIKNNIVLKGIVRDLKDVSSYIWQRGWAERNAGNISINISEEFGDERIDVESCPCLQLVKAYPTLANKRFLITGTGKRMRDLARKPMLNTLFIQLNNDGNAYWILSQKTGAELFLPTSELPAHLGIHQMIAERRSCEKVVMHTHATELIALTQSEEFCNQKTLNHILFGIHPETIVFVPKGIGFVPYTLPGTEEIAIATLHAFADHDVALWEKHGVFAIGRNVGDTFDVIDILAKSAAIFFTCRSANIMPDGFTEEQLAALKLLSSNF